MAIKLPSNINPLLGGDPDLLASIIVSMIPGNDNRENFSLTVSTTPENWAELSCWVCATDQEWAAFFSEHIGSTQSALPFSVSLVDQDERALLFDIEVRQSEIDALMIALRNKFNSLRFQVNPAHSRPI